MILFARNPFIEKFEWIFRGELAIKKETKQGYSPLFSPFK